MSVQLVTKKQLWWVDHVTSWPSSGPAARMSSARGCLRWLIFPVHDRCDTWRPLSVNTDVSGGSSNLKHTSTAHWLWRSGIVFQTPIASPNLQYADRRLRSPMPNTILVLTRHLQTPMHVTVTWQMNSVAVDALARSVHLGHIKLLSATVKRFTAALHSYLTLCSASPICL